IMAQAGSFVPATSANLPIFNKIFTRIGASDDLVSGESTFMVEMKEACNAVLNADKESLILFDELGRGTATYDGISLAQAILEYISKKIHAITLFSTHYHELTKLDKKYKNIRNVHVSAVEDGDKITFLHKVKEGAVDKSYGIHVARLANMPEELLSRASEILDDYEKNKKYKSDNVQLSMDLTNQISNEESKLIKTLKEIDVYNLTPIDALNKLYEIINDL
ncbi:MAG: DNA mismatch repair protein MutS, partial [Bacilli bacterium]|nr:DNA mismatch repair protein MutS [Bacilli bacterium]